MDNFLTLIFHEDLFTISFSRDVLDAIAGAASVCLTTLGRYSRGFKVRYSIAGIHCTALFLRSNFAAWKLSTIARTPLLYLYFSTEFRCH